MRRRTLMMGAAVMLALAAATALAVKPGGALYVKTKDTKVLEKPDPRAKVPGLLQPGTQVVWHGAAPANRQLHHVVGPDSRGKSLDGYVLQANLTPSQLAPEYLSRDDGAATKALDEVALEYAKSHAMPQQAERLMALEAISRSVVAERLAERNRQLGLAAADFGAAPDKKPTKKRGKR
jgi:hypothetical protein